MKNKKFKHKNGKTYTVTEECLLQDCGVWKDAVIYTDGELLFVRQLEEFNLKFREV